jgi:hypothetical protein
MTGRFRRIEGRPEVAALAMLVLEPDVRDAAHAVVEKRLTAIREHVIDEIDLLRESSDATRAGDRARAEELQRELFRRFPHAAQRAPLVEPLASVLPVEAHAELVRMVDEYWSAWIASEAEGRPDQPGKAAKSVEDRLAFQLFQGELVTVYNAILRPLQQKLDRIYEIAEVSDAQRESIRSAVIGFVKTSRLHADDEASMALARAILDVLDEEQRTRVLAAALSVR